MEPLSPWTQLPIRAHPITNVLTCRSVNHLVGVIKWFIKHPLHPAFTDFTLTAALEVSMASPHFTDVEMETQRRDRKSAKTIQLVSSHSLALSLEGIAAAVRGRSGK